MSIRIAQGSRFEYRGHTYKASRDKRRLIWFENEATGVRIQMDGDYIQAALIKKIITKLTTGWKQDSMKTIEEEIRERLAAENLSPENVEKCLAYIKADPLMRSMRGRWPGIAEDYGKEFIDIVWVSAWSSARDWIWLQITAPAMSEEEYQSEMRRDAAYEEEQHAQYCKRQANRDSMMPVTKEGE